MNRLISERGVRRYYMATRLENQASVRGIEKAGFVRLGVCTYGYWLYPKWFRRVRLDSEPAVPDARPSDAPGEPHSA